MARTKIPLSTERSKTVKDSESILNMKSTRNVCVFYLYKSYILVSTLSQKRKKGPV